MGLWLLGGTVGNRSRTPNVIHRLLQGLRLTRYRRLSSQVKSRAFPMNRLDLTLATIRVVVGIAVRGLLMCLKLAISSLASMLSRLT